MSKLVEFIVKHAIRGTCTCGKCIDAPAKSVQPGGHTADMIFFKVAMLDGTDRTEFLNLVKAEQPHWLDGQEHNFLELGANVGDQGVALTIMGLGYLLKVWDLLTPASLLPDLDEDLKLKMAGQGYITIIVKKGKKK